MLDTIKLILAQSPVFWASLCGTFFILGLLYSFAHWYRYATSLSLALQEQQSLLTQTSDARYRQEQRELAAKQQKPENGVVYYPYQGEERRKANSGDSSIGDGGRLCPQRRISDSPPQSLDANPWMDLQPDHAKA